ncbi:hypothetical protein [Rheinheimera baltica]|uniref:hypothetical protein n=1 Tax=Rheinheimera baltica TaxID=67576 RepID=UPI0004218119|nr:hypothetical protein [Rheinheimera baltica]MDP5190181.1 glycosyltransferase family 1 protein [Rheinheimera baltica]
MAALSTQDVIVIEERPNPSSDFFVLPYLTLHSANVQRYTFAQLAEPEALVGKTLIFVRYIPAPWRQLIDTVADKIGQIVLFIDDDVLDPAASVGMPWRYRLKLWRLSYRAVPWLKHHAAQLWVANSYLAQKYHHWQPHTLQAMPLALAPQVPVTLFYHGSSSHQAEARWLFPIVADALKAVPALNFEIIADKKIARLYRGLQKTHVLQPMSWPSYQALLQRQRYDIGLAPLLPLPFNQARSVTKFFDITQAGAVGIYAESPIYQAVQQDKSGIRLPMQPQLWRDTIVSLANDNQRRLQLLDTAKQQVRQWPDAVAQDD